MPKKAIYIILLFIILAGGLLFIRTIPNPNMETQDIYYSWLEGKRIVDGENPYARILDGNMRDNDKYATYFPAFYEFSAFSQLLGLREFSNWFQFWRLIFYACDLAIAFVLYYLLSKRDLDWLGLFAAAFWLFNRWSIKIIEIGHLDFVTLLLVLVSLALLPRRKWLAFILFGFALAIKQIPVFLTPLYLIWAWHDAPIKKWCATLVAGLLIASVPVITSLPFLIWNAEGFIKSVLFSATRDAIDQFNFMPSIDAYLDLRGLSARLPMLAIMLFAYWVYFKKQVGIFTACLLIMMTFTLYNSVLFIHYMAYPVVFVPLVMCDITDKSYSA
jgi:hypothetical protein